MVRHREKTTQMLLGRIRKSAAMVRNAAGSQAVLLLVYLTQKNQKRLEWLID